MIIKMKLRNLIKTVSILVVLVFTTAAIKAFENVVIMSKQVGDSAADLRQKAIKVLPSLYYNVASDAFTAKKPASEIIQAAKNAVAAAEKYENPSTKQNANLILIKAY